MNPVYLKNPLVSLDACRAVLAKSEDACLHLVEAGELRWAFNLASPGVSCSLLRVLSLSLADLAAGTSTQPGKLEDAIKYVLPGSAPEIRASVLARNWSVSGTHVANLIKSGCLKVARRGGYATASPLIERKSAIRFLEERHQ